MVGVGAAIPVTCAMAALQTTSAGRIAATNANLIGVLRLPSACCGDLLLRSVLRFRLV